jgi:Putative transmembrane protein (PGPGW)
LDSAVHNSKEEWRRFLGQSAPGRRFRNRYRRRQQAGRERTSIRRASYVAFGIAIAIGSLVLAPFPGPGWVTFFVGLGMIAGEVLYVARFLDRAEVRLRGALRHAKGMWDELALTGRVLVALTISLGVVASAYGAYHAIVASLSVLTVFSS